MEILVTRELHLKIIMQPKICPKAQYTVWCVTALQALLQTDLSKQLASCIMHTQYYYFFQGNGLPVFSSNLHTLHIITASESIHTDFY